MTETTRRALARPGGLAVGPDGALYVSEDVHGKIWRITYTGPADTTLQPAPTPKFAAETTHGIDVGSLPLAPGATREQVQLGNREFTLFEHLDHGLADQPGSAHDGDPKLFAHLRNLERGPSITGG